MKKTTMKSKLFIVNLLINVLLIILPIIIFAACNCWPASKNTTVLYWIMFGLFPAINIGWFVLELFKKSEEASITFVQLVLNYLILLMPFINMIFALIPSDHIALFIVPLILDIVILIVYFSITILLSHVNNKMEATLMKNKSEVVEPKRFENYENDDGSFLGSKKGGN